MLFHNWIAQHSNAIYLLKIDDDVYFRPAPLLEQLRFKSPFLYVWGYMDYHSPVPREPEDDFYNPEEIFPYETFPPYPRGGVRVVSMDVGILRCIRGESTSTPEMLKMALIFLHAKSAEVKSFA